MQTSLSRIHRFVSITRELIGHTNHNFAGQIGHEYYSVTGLDDIFTSMLCHGPLGRTETAPNALLQVIA